MMTSSLARSTPCRAWNSQNEINAASLVGETERYHKLRLQLFRLRPGDLAAPGLFPDR
jgi:hypothetical protein